MKFIKVKTQFEGFHSYKGAPKEVSFLRDKHRHLFIVTLKIEVKHNERELEFFITKRKLDRFISKQFSKLENIGSCEFVAETIMDHFESIYPRWIEVTVSEDGENEAIVNNY